MNNDDCLVIESNDFRIIQESSKYILGYLWEQAYLYIKDTKIEILLCEFDGVCDSGVISENEEWAVVGGNLIAIWKCNKEILIIDDDKLKWVNSMRQIEKDIVEILIDPWSQQAAIWQLDIKKESYIKISNFEKYKKLPYTDNVIW